MGFAVERLSGYAGLRVCGKEIDGYWACGFLWLLEVWHLAVGCCLHTLRLRHRCIGSMVSFIPYATGQLRVLRFVGAEVLLITEDGGSWDIRMVLDC